MMNNNLEILFAHLRKTIGLTEEQRDILERNVKVTNIRKKSLFIQKGEVNRKIAFIVKGLMKNYMLDAYGNQHILSFYKENEYFLDINSVALQQPAASNFEAVEETILVTLDYDKFEEIKALLPDSNRYLIQVLFKKIAFLYEDRFKLISLNAENRYKSFVENNSEYLLRLSQKDVSAYLGILPESLSRIRRFLTGNR